MDTHDHILQQHLRAQMKLEEHLSNVVNKQIAEIDEAHFSDAKKLLSEAHLMLEQQVSCLSELLSRSELEGTKGQLKGEAANERRLEIPFGEESNTIKLSQMLRDDYCALTMITVSNTLLHTTALTLNSNEVASLALKHLGNLAPLVVKMAKLLPEVVTRELCRALPMINSTGA